jgi:hypothetical protein
MKDSSRGIGWGQNRIAGKPAIFYERLSLKEDKGLLPPLSMMGKQRALRQKKEEER